jgi:cellulose synthase (UDP-forming)
LKLPLAAGLATERLAIHVGQRMRWARGMTQIFRLDNPFLGRGLSLGQRVCYMNAMLHFFFGVPRFLFLTAPLAYLMFRLNIIAASGLMVIAYALPHLWHSTVTNSRLQSKYRHSFWGEIYESVLAMYLLKPTLTTLINPKRGKFNVTEKGGLLPDDYFDYKIVRPHLIITFLLVAGLIIGLVRWWFTDYSDTEVLLLNVFWAIFNLVTISAAIAVAREARQLRGAVRHELVLPVVVHLPNGRTIATQSENISTTGAQLAIPRPPELQPGDPVEIELAIGASSTVVPAQVVGTRNRLRVMFTEMTLRQKRDVVRVVLCRADAWLDWEDHPIDAPIRSAGRIFSTITGMFRRTKLRPARTGQLAPEVPRQAPPPATAPAERPREAALNRVILAFGVGLGALAMTSAGVAQTVRGAPPPPGAAAPSTNITPGGTPSGAAAPPPQGAQVPMSAPSQMVPGAMAPQSTTPPGQPGLPGPAGASTDQTASATVGTTRRQVLTLKDLGANSPIRLLGVQGEGSLPFSVRRDEVVTDGRIDVSFAYSPALIPELSHLTVLLNGEVLGSIPLPKDKASGQTASLAINPVLFQQDNRILFRFIGHYTLGCEDPMHSSLWLVLSNTSQVSMQLQKLTLSNDLSLLPAPFYDSKDMQALTLPFVFSARPSPAVLQAAGITASWFGSLASYKGATFPVSFDTLPNGNAVVFATSNERPAGINLPGINGPTIATVPNPGNAEAKLLLVMGRTPQELSAAAQTLALGSVALSGSTQVVGAPDIPERQAYDAPKWIPMNRPVRFGELVQPTDLQGNGLVPGLLTVNFRTAPDIFVWGNTGIPLDVRYRYPAGTWLNFDDSRLDVSINNSYLRSLPLTREGVVQQVKDIISPDFVLNQQTVRTPPYYIFGQNQLQFYYDLRPMKRGECQDVLPNNVQESIDPDSTIDLSGTERFTTLPNLAFFVNSGYPFTKYADLNQTAVVVPDQLTQADVQTYLTLMGMMGDSTGFPVARVTVVDAAGVDQVANKDLIVLGALSRQPLIAKWTENSRLRIEDGRLRVAVTSPIDRVYTTLDPNVKQERERVDQLLVQQGDNLATMIGMESPLSSGHTAVIITGSTPEKQLTVLNSFRNRELNPLIQGDLMVATQDKVTSFRVGNEYTVGSLPTVTKIRWWFGNSPLLLILCTLIGVLIIALVAYWILSRIAARRLAGRPVP